MVLGRRSRFGGYSCVDKVQVTYRQDTFGVKYSRKALPKNGIQASGETFISGTMLSRDITEVFGRGHPRTFTFPLTIKVVHK